MTRIAPLGDDELIASCPSGLNLIPDQAVTTLDDYAIAEYYDSDSDREQAQSAPPMPPLKLADSSTELSCLTCENADHPEDAYALVKGKFRYVAPATVEELDMLGEG